MIISGNDDYSRFVITNNKSPKNLFLELSPEEFHQKILQSMKKEEYDKNVKKFGENVATSLMMIFTMITINEI